MTPELAQRLLEHATPGPWETEHERVGKLIRPVRLAVDMTNIDNILLAKHAPELAAQVAGLTEEWGVKFQTRDGRWFVVMDSWSTSKSFVQHMEERWQDDGYETRLVRRYVSEAMESD